MKNTKKIDEIDNKLIQLLTSLQSLKSKYLTLISVNYLQFLSDDFSLNSAQISDSILSSLVKVTNNLSSSFENLKNNGFFGTYGLYQKNDDKIEKFVGFLIEAMNISKPFLKNPNFGSINFGSDVRKYLDAAVETCNKNIENINSEKRLPGEFKANLKNISDELTFIFWFHDLAKESEIDDKTFLKQMERVLKVIGRNIKCMDRDKMVDEVDNSRSNTITPKEVQEFFNFGLTHPTVTIYDLKEKDEEDDEEKTLKRKKKNPKIEKNEDDNSPQDPTEKINKRGHKIDISKHESAAPIKKKPEVEEVDDDATNKKNKRSKVNKVEDKKDEEDDDSATIGRKKKPSQPTTSSKTKNKPFNFDNMNLVDSLKYYEAPLVLKVLEVNEKAPGIFKVNSRITISPDSFQIDKEPPVKLLTKYIAKFGRESDMQNYQADIKFDRSLREISRKQFQILLNDPENYTLVCTSPPPKTETSFKMTDEPYLLKADSILTLCEQEVIVIDKLFHNNEKNDAIIIPEFQENETNVQNMKRKNNNAVKMEMDKNIFRNEILKNDRTVGIPYLIIQGVIHDSDISGKSLRIDQEKYPDGFEFGKDLIFKKNPKANNESKIFYKKDEGWFIESYKPSDPKWKLYETRISVGLYEQITKGNYSDPVVLKPGMVIHINGFSFRVENH